MTALRRTYHTAEHWLRLYMDCGRKIQYISRTEAESGADRARSRFGSRQEPYRCEHCGGYHNRTVKNA